ncbi:hypothetical protein MKW94_017526 [Papaver nudicaule]|uniref:Dirigent protein n=1 Tax=Papaver nudicaule TaxID=74823 RepID=A0AA41SAJ7_PAPNU|nr:hypothetical protein [Papaver nudicaule]
MHFKQSLSVAVFSIFVIFYIIQIAVALELFPKQETNPVTLSLRVEKFSHFHMYLHEKGGEPNPTTILVASANTTMESPTGFGAIAVCDSALTAGPEPSSELLGRAQGFYTSAGAVSIMGRNTLVPEVREMPIVGGTGLLRFARGYVEGRTHSFNITAREATFEYDIYVYHY